MSRRVLALVALVALLTPAAVFAQTAGVTRSRLPNGLTVVVRENAEAPVEIAPAWHENIGKRQVKAPKVYLRDSGLLHAELGIRTRDQPCRTPPA
jgi:hypothetical protein